MKNFSIFAVTLVTVCVVVASCMGATPNPPQPTMAPTATMIPATSTPSNTPTPIPTDTPTGPRDQFGDGVWRVGVDIIAGTYRTEGGEFCYWERMKDFKAVFESIIANGNSAGPIVIQIEPGDAGFKAQGCGVWLIQK